MGAVTCLKASLGDSPPHCVGACVCLGLSVHRLCSPRPQRAGVARAWSHAGGRSMPVLTERWSVRRFNLLF